MSDRKELLDATIAAFNAKDYDGIVAFYTDDAEVTVPGRPTVRGKAAIKETWQTQFSVFPDAVLKPTSFVDAGDAIVIELVFEGTNTGEVLLPDGNKLPPTGKKVSLRSASVAELDGDLIKRHTVYGDNVELMAQLGLLPAPANA